MFQVRYTLGSSPYGWEITDDVAQRVVPYAKRLLDMTNDMKWHTLGFNTEPLMITIELGITVGIMASVRHAVTIFYENESDRMLFETAAYK